jgi:hypothetical protein
MTPLRAFLTLILPERKRLLQFVVCGGGPTGVETAAVSKHIKINPSLRNIGVCPGNIRPVPRRHPKLCKICFLQLDFHLQALVPQIMQGRSWNLRHSVTRPHSQYLLGRYLQVCGGKVQPRWC